MSFAAPNGIDPVQFHAVFEAIPNPILVLGTDIPVFTILAVNDAYLRSSRLQREEVIGQPLFKILPTHTGLKENENGERIINSLKFVALQGQSHTIPLMQYNLQGKDEAEVILRYYNLKHSPVYNKVGEVQSILQVATEITESLAEDELDIYPTLHIPEKENIRIATKLNNETSSAYLQAIIDTSQTGMILLSPVKDEEGKLKDFRFRIANRTLGAYVGAQPEELTGSLASKWFPDYKTNGLFDTYAETCLTGKPNRLDFHYHADNINVWLDILATRINEDVLVTFSDFTQLKQLQHKMEGSLSDLKKSNSNLEEFAYVASHDLQEPLRKIKSFGDMLSMRYKEQLGLEGADMITRMQLAAERMKALIEDLLTYSKISAQHHIAEPVNMDEVIAGVLTDLDSCIKEKKALIHIDPIQPMVGDPRQLRQAFQNLLSNALKFTKKDTQPEIHISSDIISASEATELMIHTEQSRKQYQRIVIRDNGIGFDQQYGQRIFQLFQRLHGRMDYPGTGIGLSIVQKVIDHHQGYIKAESESGKGAVFTVLLPI